MHNELSWSQDLTLSTCMLHVQRLYIAVIIYSMYSSPMFGLWSGLEFSTCAIMWVLRIFGFQGCGCDLVMQEDPCGAHEATQEDK